MASRVLKASVIIGGSISGALKSALSFTEKSLKRVGGAIADVDRKQRQIGQSIQVFGRMGKNVDGLRRQYADLVHQGERLRGVYASLDRIEKSRAANLANRQNLGGNLMGSAATLGAVGYALSRPIGGAATFSRENQLIGNTADMTSEQIKALGQTILIESRNTNQGADELQRSIGFLIAAGMDARTAQASIRTIGRTTTAAGAEIEDLSRAAFTLQDSLGIKPTGLQSALDILALAGKEGNVELKDMAKVLPVLGSSFQALKMQGNEAAATMGAALEVARKGASSADEAANNMQNFMAKIMSPETLKKAQKGFGLDLYKIITDAQTTGDNPFEAAMSAVMKATEGDQKKIGQLFGDMQVQNFVRPMIQNWDEYNRIKNKALNESAGTTDRDFANMMQTDAERMKGAKIAADNLSKAFGTALMPAIGEAAVKLTDLLDRATAFVQANPKLIATTTKVVVGMLAMRTAVLGLRYAWTFVRGPILLAQRLFQSFRAGTILAQLGKFGPAAMRIASVFRTVATAVAAIGGGPIAIAIAAITAAALLVRKYWEPIKAFLGGVWDGLREAGGQAMGELMRAVEPLRPAWEAVGGLLRQAWDWISNLIAPAQYSGAELSKVASIGKLVGQALLMNFRMGIQVIGDIIKAVAWFGEVLGTCAGWIVENLGKVWDKIKGPAAAAIAWIMDKLQPLLDGIGWVTDKVGGGLGWAKDKAVDGAKVAVGQTVNAGLAYQRLQAAGGGVGDMARSAHTAGTGVTSAVTGRMANLQAGAAQGRAAPAMPAPAARGATTVHQSQINHIAIQQQPGESGESVARRTADELQRRQAIQGRSSLGDRS